MKRTTLIWMLLWPSLLPFAGCTRNQTKNALVVDVPALIGKDFKQIQTIIGKPTEDTAPTAAAKKAGIWDNGWWFDNGLLGVEYRLDNYKILNFFLATSESAYGTKSKESLLVAGNLKENDPSYRLRFAEVKDAPGQYTGVFIYPK